MIQVHRLAVVLLLLGGADAFAQGIFGARARVWWADPDGDFEFENSPPDASTIDVNSDLGLGDPKMFYNVTGYLSMPGASWRISVDYLRGSFHETTTLPETATFNESVFAAGSSIETTLDVQRFELFIDQMVYPAGDGGLYSSLGFIWSQVDVTLSGSGSPTDDSIDGIFPIAGFHADIPIAGFLRGIGRIAYTQLKIGHKAIHTFELEGGLGVVFGDHFGVEAGYRLWRLDLHNDEGRFESEDIDLRLSGPFVGLSLLF